MRQDDIISNLRRTCRQNEDVSKELLAKLELAWTVRLRKTARQFLRRHLARPVREFWCRPAAERVVAKINAETGKKKIVFLAGFPTFDFLGISMYLRKTGGYETYLFMENPHLINTMEGHFDAVYVYDSFSALAGILDRISPFVIHTQGAISYYFFAILAKALTTSPVVVGLYDIPTFGIKADDYENLWGRADMMLDAFVAEQFAFTGCDGVLVTIHELEAGQILRDRAGSNVPIAEFHSYICPEFVPQQQVYPDLGSGVRIVYGGIVIESGLPTRLYGDVQLIHLARKLTSQGLYFDIYPSPHFRASSTKRRLAEFVELAAVNPLFHFQPALPPQLTAAEFGKYHFASMMYLLEGADWDREHYRMTIPSKFFKYIEAGLPVIVSEELGYVSRLVRDYEIGIVVSRKDIDRLAGIIQSCDYEKLRANVKNAQRELSMEKHISRLIDFYEQAALRQGARQNPAVEKSQAPAPELTALKV